MFWCTNDERNEIQSTDHSVRKEAVAKQKAMKLNEIQSTDHSVRNEAVAQQTQKRLHKSTRLHQQHQKRLTCTQGILMGA